MKDEPYNRSNILPFKIVNTVPTKDTQLLLTSRSQRKITTKTKRPSVSPAIITLPRCLSPPTSELIIKWRSDLFHAGSSSPVFDRNIANLRKVLHTPLAPRATLKISSSLQQNLYNLSQIILEEPNDYSSPKNSEERNAFRLVGTTLFAFCTDCKGDLPSSQEYSQLCFIHNKIYLQESCGRKGDCSLRELDPCRLTWRLVQALDTPKSRLGFVCVAYRNKIVLYGGSRAPSKSQAHRRFPHKLYIYSCEAARWNRYPGKGSVPVSRRNHAGAVIGRYLVVYGGINSEAKTLGDLCLLDLKTKEWMIPDLMVINDPGPRASASLTAVYSEEIVGIENYNFFSMPLRENNGFYLFGGVNNGVVTNSMHVLCIRAGKLIWSDVKCRGVIPAPRHSHTACAIGLKLYVFGGRNDEMYKNGYEISGIHSFSCKNLEWEQLEIKGSIPGPRWGHSMIALTSKIFVFGGMSYNKYSENKLYSIETDKRIIKDILMS